MDDALKFHAQVLKLGFTARTWGKDGSDDSDGSDGSDSDGLNAGGAEAGEEDNEEMELRLVAGRGGGRHAGARRRSHTARFADPVPRANDEARRRAKYGARTVFNTEFYCTAQPCSTLLLALGARFYARYCALAASARLIAASPLERGTGRRVREGEAAHAPGLLRPGAVAERRAKYETRRRRRAHDTSLYNCRGQGRCS
jgi:hypothetical protein